MKNNNAKQVVNKKDNQQHGNEKQSVQSGRNNNINEVTKRKTRQDNS